MTSPAIPEPRSASGCATCTTARCCVVFDPELTGADLHRLVRALGLGAHDIAELHPVHADQAEGSGLRFGDDCTWELRLRRTAHAPPGADGGAQRCGFLVGLGPGHNRCGVYAHRPMVCRTFPSDLTALGVMVGTPPAICPPNAWSQARADLAGLHALHLVARAEHRRHEAFVARWNQHTAEHPITGRADRLALLAAALLAFWDADPHDPDLDGAFRAAIRAGSACPAP